MSSSASDHPTIGITMGDAAGIGPEIVLKALSDENLRRLCRCIVIGDGGHLRKMASALGLDLSLTPINDPSGAGDDGIVIFDLKNLPAEFPVGVDAAPTGKAAAEY